MLSLVLLWNAVPAPQAAASTLRVGFNSGFAPYQFIDLNGQAVGIHIDMLDYLANEQPFELEYIPYESTAACFDALRSGDIDLVLGAPEGSNIQHEFIRTDTLTTYTMCLLGNSSLANMISAGNYSGGSYGAIEKGYTNKLPALLTSQKSRLFSNSVITFLNSQEVILQKLEAGEINFAICEKESALYYLQQMPSSNLSMEINSLFQDSSAIFLRPEDAILLRELNQGLGGMRANGNYSRILDRWIIPADTLTISPQMLRIISLLVVCAIVGVGAYIFISTRLRAFLQQQVEQRTQELYLANESLSNNVLQLQRESAIRNSIIQNSASAMLIVDDNRMVSFLNQRALYLSGMTYLHVDNIPVDEIPILGKLYSIGETRTDISEKPIRLSLRQDGKVKTFRCALYQLPLQNGYLFSAEDITSEEAEKQAVLEQEKSRMLNTLVAGIAHELKNPLTAIQAYSSLLPAQLDNPDFVSAFFRSVPKEIKRINSLVESLIDYAKPAQGSPIALNLASLLQDCIDLTASIAQTQGITIEAQLDPDIQILANQDQIRQSLVNYIMNSLDSVQEKQSTSEPAAPGLVRVTLESIDDTIARIEIYDEGIGMDSEELQQCMNPFYTTKAKGTGLGMAIALSRIQDNGGEVFLSSQKGSYTRVTINFERYSDEAYDPDHG